MNWSSPMLSFQDFSSFFSSTPWLWFREVWWECVPVAAAMDGTDWAGRKLAESPLLASFLDRCWRTLIMASFSMIFAYRFFILVTVIIYYTCKCRANSIIEAAVRLKEVTWPQLELGRYLDQKHFSQSVFKCCILPVPVRVSFNPAMINLADLIHSIG